MPTAALLSLPARCATPRHAHCLPRTAASHADRGLATTASYSTSNRSNQCRRRLTRSSRGDPDLAVKLRPSPQPPPTLSLAAAASDAAPHRICLTTTASAAAMDANALGQP
ncbi:hypothetical protein OsI_38171 [Oryza sativa Indica Group]|uniref:Uncharacterized protein n=1 Tax=Oryza sativa subsp. indica TaxID=39946 RepID=B8BPD9_ORYSI|nr:hypothetical protein OsI_38171 [Oryza sativa Indica Group]